MSKDSLSINELGKEFEKKFFTGTWVCHELRFLLGRILTIVDASVIDQRQNKAMKDLMKGEFVKELNHVSETLSNGREIIATEEEVAGAMQHGGVSEDEALGLI